MTSKQHLGAALAPTAALLAVVSLVAPAPTRANRADVKWVDIAGDVNGAAFDRAGNFWFCQHFARSLGRIDATTREVKTWPLLATAADGTQFTPSAEPSAVAVDDQGDVWVNDLPGAAGGGAAYLLRFHPETETFDSFVVNPQWWNGYGGSIWLMIGGLAKAPDGKIWFNDKSAGPRIGFVDPATGEIFFHLPGIGYSPWSVDVAVTPGGQAYWSNGWQYTGAVGGLYRYDAAANASTWTGIPAAHALDVDASGNLWLLGNSEAVHDPAVLARISPDGTLTWFPQLQGVRWMQFALDAQGTVWFPPLVELDPATGATVGYDVGAAGIENVYFGAGRMAITTSAWPSSASRVGFVASVDHDGDGVLASSDCNDRDASVFPGAAEVARDGIDQDCNGYDLTIQVVRASYATKQKALRVEATSALGAAAALVVQGYGAMTWDALTGWTLNGKSVASAPASVMVCGVEGCASAPVVAR